jgi:fatty-acyl-CoA synthase
VSATDDRSLPWVFDQTIGSVLALTAQRHSNRDALIFPALGVRWTWGELEAVVSRVAAGLIGQGIPRGAHLGIWSMNVPEWVVLQFAAARAGVVLVNINPAYRLHELEDALVMADVDTLVVGCPFKGSDFVAMVRGLCPESESAPAGAWTSPRLPRLRRLVALGDKPGPSWISWSELEPGNPAAAAELASRQAETKPGDVFNIQFTSGTTGLPKGAMLTHRNLLMNAYYVAQRLRYSPDDRVCVPVPFYHCFGCVLGTLVCAVVGSAIVVPAPAFDPAATLAAIEQECCTSIYGVPTMFVAQLEHPDFASRRLTSLRTGIMAGAPCPLPLMQRVIEVMGVREICIGYGQTEASPIITLTEADDPIEVRVGTVGRPIPGVDVKLIDVASGNPVPPGQAGELCARGHCVMAGYYNQPEATAKAIDPEGWLHTGDLGLLRDDGNYRIVGRRKELIIRGGENIYPPEVEEFLLRHPDIVEAAVVGLPDAKYGEIVAAWVVPRQDAGLTAEEVRTFCQGQIAHYKIPSRVFLVDSLPRTVTGKVRKHLLRDQAIHQLGLEDVASIPTA